MGARRNLQLFNGTVGERLLLRAVSGTISRTWRRLIDGERAAKRLRIHARRPRPLKPFRALRERNNSLCGPRMLISGKIAGECDSSGVSGVCSQRKLGRRVPGTRSRLHESLRPFAEFTTSEISRKLGNTEKEAAGGRREVEGSSRSEVSSFGSAGQGEARMPLDIAKLPDFPDNYCDLRARSHAAGIE